MARGVTLDLKECRDRFNSALEQDRENREEALDDLQFLAGEQWPESIKTAREAASRPVITINRMPQFVRQVTGDIRQTNPAIDVMPGDADADADMAETLAGIIRGIEYQWDAASIYERAAESAAACGMGAFRVYHDKTRRGVQIVIEGIDNPFAVHWDPMAKDPTRKDARWCFIVDRMDKAEFEAAYPDATPTDFGSGDVPDEYRHWFGSETVQIAEYWWRENGAVYWAKITANEVLEGPFTFPGEHLPIFAVTGEELHLGDRVVRTSVIRYAKDAQRLYNYWRSAHAEVVALQPKAPYKLTPRQIEGHEAYWNTANTANLPYLLYNPDERAPGSPQRETPPVPSSAMLQEIGLASDEMKATTGIYDAALGNASNEKSGVAIRQRQLESDVSTSIYVDNLSKAIQQCGRVIVDMIAVLYNETRMVRTIAPNGDAAMVQLNQPVMTEDGPGYVNDPSRGFYDVRIKTGPSYTTQRQEAADKLIQFVQAFPAAAQVAGDIVARNMDFPGADELADRLARLIPPGVVQRDPEEMTPEERQQAAMQQQAAQQQAQMAQMMAQLQMQRAQAETQEAEADAMEAGADAAKATVEAQRAQMEFAAQSGQMNAAIAQIVQQEVARVLSQMMARPPLPGPFN